MTCLHPALVFASDAYLKLYTAITVLAFAWKGCFLSYESSIFWLELMSAVLILPSIAAAVYFMIWQQYVLRIEVITNAILILLQGLHAITSFL